MIHNRYLEARPIGLIVAVYHVETENGPRIFHKHYLTLPGAHPGSGGPLVRYRHYAVVARNPTERCPECGDGESDFEDSALICPTCGGDGDGW